MYKKKNEPIVYNKAPTVGKTKPPAEGNNYSSPKVVDNHYVPPPPSPDSPSQPPAARMPLVGKSINSDISKQNNDRALGLNSGTNHSRAFPEMISTIQPKKRFSKRVIVGVVVILLFIGVGATSILISRRQQQVAAPVAPTAPVSRPSASSGIDLSDISCQENTAKAVWVVTELLDEKILESGGAQAVCAQLEAFYTNHDSEAESKINEGATVDLPNISGITYKMTYSIEGLGNTGVKIQYYLPKELKLLDHDNDPNYDENNSVFTIDVQEASQLGSYSIDTSFLPDVTEGEVITKVEVSAGDSQEEPSICNLSLITKKKSGEVGTEYDDINAGIGGYRSAGNLVTLSGKTNGVKGFAGDKACNEDCSASDECANPNHICYKISDEKSVCRLTENPESETCASTQPVAPDQLPVTGPSDWLNWLKAGLATLGMGALLFLLL